MTFEVLTLFPEMFAALQSSMTGRALEAGTLRLSLTDIRAHTLDKHRRCDDYPFGGGAGMVMTAQPVMDALASLPDEAQAYPRICLSPRGAVLTQARAVTLAQQPGLVLLCGHYEGIDQRALDLGSFEELSIGDYVLTGGELPAMVLIDAVSRYVPGVLGSSQSTDEESHAAGLLEYPHYTRPAEFRGVCVPEVLLSGHHANIVAWRREQSLRITGERRPDLLP